VYETNAKGKIGRLDVRMYRDSLGYHIRYVSDREIDIILDTADLSTVYIEKYVGGKLELKIETGSGFNVYFKGAESRFRDDGDIYDRHTLDYALRRFDYHPQFKTIFRLHIPELTIVNAEVEVIGEERITTPVGEFDCWKIQMKPRILFFNWKFFFYIEKEFPRRFIKYRDSSGENTITLIELNP
jgi:hypothetical protein